MFEIGIESKRRCCLVWNLKVIISMKTVCAFWWWKTRKKPIMSKYVTTSFQLFVIWTFWKGKQLFGYWLNASALLIDLAAYSFLNWFQITFNWRMSSQLLCIVLSWLSNNSYERCFIINQTSLIYSVSKLSTKNPNPSSGNETSLRV